MTASGVLTAGLIYFQISAYSLLVPRRRPGSLLELEVGILRACVDAGPAGTHGFAIAKTLVDSGDTRSLTATGTLYRALHRLEAAGLVESHWEDQDAATGERRPRRRIYRVSGAGAAALATAHAAASPNAGVLRVRPEGA
jgi:hypothetical protein